MAELEPISVIIPTYNRADFVCEAIESVLAQTYTDYEIIVVDDGSKDTSPDIVNRFMAAHAGRVKLKHLEHSGPYPARNLGLRHATGEYIAFLDADDWWRVDCLEKLQATLEENGADLSYCGWQNVGAHNLSPEPYVPPAYETEDPVAALLS